MVAGLLWLDDGDTEPLLFLPVAIVFFVSEGLPEALDGDAAAESCSNIRLASLTLLPGLVVVGLVAVFALGLSAAALGGAGLSLSFLPFFDDLVFLPPPRLPSFCERLVAGDDIVNTAYYYYLQTKEHTDKCLNVVKLCAQSVYTASTA